MKTNPKTRRGFTLVELLVVIVIIASLAGLTAPMVIRQRKKADQTEATSNARQIGLAMFEFETEYGSFPDGATEALVLNEAGYTLGTTASNDYFRQLLAADLSQSEAMFFAKTKRSPRKPDGDIDGAEALKGGEVGFAYILNGTAGQSTAGNPSRVIAAAPLLLASDDFDPDPYDKKAVLLRVDNSVSSVPIDSSNKAVLVSGATPVLLLDPGGIWGDATTGVQPTMVGPAAPAATP